MSGPVLLKPSEYQGAQGTAVAGRIVICNVQEVEPRSKAHSAAAPAKGRGGKGKPAKAPHASGASTKIELHLSGTESASEVLYIEAWGELAQQVQQKCQVGDLITLVGGTIIHAAQPYSTSKLHYYLRLKGVLGVQIIISKVDTLPWPLPPKTHPLVPLHSLSRVREKQFICVAAVVVENAGSTERLTKDGMAPVCNAIVQEGGTRVRCAFWRDMADKLASITVDSCILLYQVLVSKKTGDTESWELGSWRGTQILPCPEELADRVKLLWIKLFSFASGFSSFFNLSEVAMRLLSCLCRIGFLLTSH